MKIKTLTLILICTLTSAILTAQTSKISWQPTLLEIDGNPNDWTTKLRFYDSESKISFELRNDAKQLYFVLKSEDKNFRNQLEQAGLKIKIMCDADIKTKATFELMKKNNTASHMPPPMGNGQQQGPPQRQEGNNSFNPPPMGENNFRGGSPGMHKQVPDTANIKGFQNSKKETISSVSNNPAKIRFSKSQPNTEEAAFEISIPLTELFGEKFDLQQIALNPLKIQVVIPGTSSGSQSKGEMGGRGNMGGGPGGGMGGPGGGMGGPGGGMGGPGSDMGGPSGGNSGERPEMPEGQNQSTGLSKKSFQLTFQLATNETN